MPRVAVAHWRASTMRASPMSASRGRSSTRRASGRKCAGASTRVPVWVPTRRRETLAALPFARTTGRVDRDEGLAGVDGHAGTHRHTEIVECHGTPLLASAGGGVRPGAHCARLIVGLWRSVTMRPEPEAARGTPAVPRPASLPCVHRGSTLRHAPHCLQRHSSSGSPTSCHEKSSLLVTAVW